jgi:cobalt-zinc-cadmium efflux system membrane fusion protein
MMRPTPILLPLVLGSSLLLTACGEQSQATPVPAASASTANSATPKVTKDSALITPKDSLRARLTLAPVPIEPWREIQRVPATVVLDERRMARIGSAVSGRVNQIRVQPGDLVQRGEVLAILHSSELADAQLAYLKALSGKNLKSHEAQRARSLLASGVISAAELQRRENMLDEVSFDVSALADRLRVLGMSQNAIDTLAKTRKIDSTATITAGMAGTVIERKIAPGQVLQPSDDAFTVADLSHVWVVAQAPERAVSDLGIGQEVEIAFPALGEDAPRAGKIIFISPTVSPQTRTVAVRSDVENTDGRLKPDMLAVMEIQENAQSLPVIPSRAVVREGNQDYVFVEQADRSFRLTRVDLGIERRGKRPVLGGLNGGEIIVMDGAFHLNNERRRTELE